ncbi:MAG: protein-L-isoaspartate O-methyltransferase [bacterium]
MKDNNDLVQRLKLHGLLISKPVRRAFKSIDRKDFVRESLISSAYLDIPLPIGSGQTISQPSTVAIMLELLELKRGQKILDIGYGSGYTTALLAAAIGSGKVIAIELKKDLAKWGQKNIGKYNFIKKGLVQATSGDGYKGLPEEAPFDRILVSAEAEEIPVALKNQLKIGGILIVPFQNALFKIRRKNDKKFEISQIPGFVFVPLVKNP